MNTTEFLRASLLIQMYFLGMMIATMTSISDTVKHIIIGVVLALSIMNLTIMCVEMKRELSTK